MEEAQRRFLPTHGVTVSADGRIGKPGVIVTVIVLAEGIDTLTE